MNSLIKLNKKMMQSSNNSNSYNHITLNKYSYINHPLIYYKNKWNKKILKDLLQKNTKLKNIIINKNNKVLLNKILKKLKLKDLMLRINYAKFGIIFVLYLKKQNLVNLVNNYLIMIKKGMNCILKNIKIFVKQIWLNNRNLYTSLKKLPILNILKIYRDKNKKSLKKKLFNRPIIKNRDKDNKKL